MGKVSERRSSEHMRYESCNNSGCIPLIGRSMYAFDELMIINIIWFSDSIKNYFNKTEHWSLSHEYDSVTSVSHSQDSGAPHNCH